MRTSPSDAPPHTPASNPNKSLLQMIEGVLLVREKMFGLILDSAHLVHTAGAEGGLAGADGDDGGAEGGGHGRHRG